MPYCRYVHLARAAVSPLAGGGERAQVLGDGQVACTAGIQCDAQAAGRLQHALGRGALDLGSGSLGAKKVEQLVEAGVLRQAR